jgi:hypothetical protein
MSPCEDLILRQATKFRVLLAIGFGVGAFLQPIQSQQPAGLEGAFRWRSIGPYRGGRVTAVAGMASQPLVYYMGATGGGVWKTEDAGVTWNNISDGFFRNGSVGAIAVAASNPDVIFKTADYGRSWQANSIC